MNFMVRRFALRLFFLSQPSPDSPPDDASQQYSDNYPDDKASKKVHCFTFSSMRWTQRSSDI